MKKVIDFFSGTGSATKAFEESDKWKVVRVEKEQLKSKPPRFSDEEYLEKKQGRIERIVDHRVESSPDIDGLVEDVQRLQEQVKELNGGREEWFMDLQQNLQNDGGMQTA